MAQIVELTFHIEVDDFDSAYNNTDELKDYLTDCIAEVDGKLLGDTYVVTIRPKVIQ